MPRSDTAIAFLDGDFGKSLLSDPRDKYFGRRMQLKAPAQANLTKLRDPGWAHREV
jgi:hypothetical protein